MIDRLRRQEVAHRAEEVIREMGLDSLPIDPFAIAARRDILVQPKDAPSGVSGFLMRVGNHFAIAYATHVDSEGFHRFSVAHELGHYFLPGHPEHVLGDREVHASRAGFASGDSHELEADHFAANLLMPTRLFDAASRMSGQGFPAIERVAATCRTSLTATAIRYATRAADPVAVIVSSGSRVDYCFLSNPLRELRGLRWLRKGSVLPRSSATASFNAVPDNVRGSARLEASTTLDDWFDGAPELEVNEDIVGLGSYGKTLTVLHAEEITEGEGA